MGTEQTTYAYAGDILKWTEHESGDGTIYVYGAASSPRVDLDSQSCDPAWLKSAMPAWFQLGNVREQHSSVAAGVGVELEEGDGNQWMLKSHIVDPGTVLKVKTKTLKGYSIGVRNGRVDRRKAANGAKNGVIVGGDIYEVSLVDRPCNPDSMITICKSVGGEPMGAVDTSGDILATAPVVGFGELDISDPDYEAPAGDEQPAAEVDVIDDEDGVSLFDDDQLSLFDDDQLSLFDEADDMEMIDDPAELAEVAKSLGAGDGVMITKGLLDTLLNGPGKDGDGDGKTGEGKKGSDSAARAARRRKLREQRRKEREDARKHRGAMDAERAQDSVRAGRAGRKLEQAEHAGRMGRYDKAVGDDELGSGLTATEHRQALRLARSVLAGDIEPMGLEITKAVREAYDESDDIDGAQEVIAQLAELIISEAEELAMGRFEEVHDIDVLLEAVRAMLRFCEAEKRQGGLDYDGNPREDVVHKGVGVDVSTTPDTIAVAEIVKTHVDKATQALQADLAEARAQLAEIMKSPVPGGPILIKSAPAAAPAAVTRVAALHAAASSPNMDPETAAAYRALAEREAALQG